MVTGIWGSVADAWWEMWHKAMLKALKTLCPLPKLAKGSPDIRSCGWLASPTSQRVSIRQYLLSECHLKFQRAGEVNIYYTLISMSSPRAKMDSEFSCQMNNDCGNIKAKQFMLP